MSVARRRNQAGGMDIACAGVDPMKVYTIHLRIL
jgi:hypothetical protein